MKIVILVFLIFIQVIQADVLPSKDSLKVYNDHSVKEVDFIYLINEGTTSVTLDSVSITIDELGQGELIDMEKPAVEYKYYNLVESEEYYYLGYMKKNNEGQYLVVRENSIMPLRLRVLAPGDSVLFQRFEIGDCFTCLGLPLHPSYAGGTFQFHLNDGTIKSVHLYSDTLHAAGTVKKFQPVVTSRHDTDKRSSLFLLNGRKIDAHIFKNRYGMRNSITVSLP